MLIAAWSMAGAGAAPLAPPDTIEERVKPCLICHAAEGKSGKNEYYPRLAGKPRGYLLNQMVNFREGQRHHRAMALLLQNLSDAYLAEFADYFAAQQPHYVAAQGKSSAPTLVDKGDSARKIPACVACHGKGLLGVAPDIPGLVGLPHDYISAQFGAWRVGTRRAAAPDCMGEIARQLSEVEVHAVAAWLAAQPLATDDRPAPALTAALPTKCGSVSAGTTVPASP
jgi:cytochrome c553